MHAELIFKIPEEAMEFQMASWGHRYWATLDGIRTVLRNRNKHGVSDGNTVYAINMLLDEISPLMDEL